MRESYVESKVCRYARARGWYTMKLSGPGDKGKPDRIFMTKGERVKFVEFKAPGKTPTQLQRKVLRDFEEMGFEVHVVDHPGQAEEIFGE